VETPGRVLVTVAGGAALGALAFLDQEGISLYSQSTYDALHSVVVGVAITIVLPILVGIIVRRQWALLALVGPLLVLGYLEATGYRSKWHDGNSPLLSPEGVFHFIWWAGLISLGVFVGRFAEDLIRGRSASGHWRV
jgi:hypothetical protein